MKDLQGVQAGYLSDGPALLFSFWFLGQGADVIDEGSAMLGAARYGRCCEGGGSGRGLDGTRRRRRRRQAAAGWYAPSLGRRDQAAGFISSVPFSPSS